MHPYADRVKQLFAYRTWVLSLGFAGVLVAGGCQMTRVSSSGGRQTGALSGSQNAGKDNPRFTQSKPKQNRLENLSIHITPPLPTEGVPTLEPPLALAFSGLPEKVSRTLTPWLDLMPLAWPIAGAHLSGRDNHLPGAPRAYRKGFHEGLDFYGRIYTGAGVDIGTPALAVADGVVIRVIRDYTEMTRDQHRKLLADQNWKDLTAPMALDQLRGRQVWVRLGPVVQGKSRVARYCHLSAVAAELQPGSPVKKGQVIGAVGNTGTTNGVLGTRLDAHLHFELRYGFYDNTYLPRPAAMPVDDFVGEGLSFAESRQAVGLLFLGRPALPVTP